MSIQYSNRPLDEPAAAYEIALRAYLSGHKEEQLRQAYELGRAAMLHDQGVLDVVDLHYQALRAILAHASPIEITQHVKGAMVFLEESLSPFEITHRGYMDAMELVRHVTNFTSVACHEVKAPLTSILSSVGMLQEMLQVEQNSSENKLLVNVLNGVAILKARTEDMMDIASLYAGTLDIRVRPVIIPDFLRQLGEHLRPEVQWRGMRLNVDIDPAIQEAEIDPERIAQIVTNLVQNAAKYATEGRQIDLSAAAQGDYLLIEVRDYGNNGSSAEHIRQLLAQESLHRDIQAHGTGLGLILCKQLVEAHHGRITVADRAGVGNTFQLWLPVSQTRHDLEGAHESARR